MPITRQVKNVVKNYSNVEVKVREATSNDPWGPSSSLMADIADQTYNVVAFSEIMVMIWKRLNDHGKNWRHVYKSLVLLDYILKTGSERVAQQCRENIFAIQTLKDFQFIDRDGKDQGMNVREKSKQLVALLKDEERLKNERTRAIKAKERLSQASGGSSRLKPGSTLRESGSASDVRVERASEASPGSRSWEPERRTYNSDIEKSRPSNPNEEELQLQLALALSKQEADETKQEIDKDEQRFKIAVNESRNSLKRPGDHSLLNMASSGGPVAVLPPVDPWGASAPPPQHSTDPWGQPTWGPSEPPADPWGEIPSGPPRVAPPPSAPTTQAVVIPPEPTPAHDPWGYSAPSTSSQPQPDPWGAPSQPPPFKPAGSGNPWDADPFSEVPPSSNDLFATSSADPWPETSQPTTNGGPGKEQPFGMTSIGNSLPTNTKEKDLIANHSTLVNLDSLISVNTESNPFFTPAPQPTKPGNPFATEKPAAPSLNQLRTNPVPLVPQATNPSPFGDPLLPAPLIPSGSAGPPTTSNPFL
jgi:epsin